VLKENSILPASTDSESARTKIPGCTNGPGLAPPAEFAETGLAIVSGLAWKKTGSFSFTEENSFYGLRPDCDENPDSLLTSVLPLFQAAIWEVWAGTLELILLNPGQNENGAQTFDPSFQQPGICWLDRVYALDRAEVSAFFSLAESDPARRSIDYRVMLPTGELLWVRHWLLRRSTEANGGVRLTGLIGAISEQKRLEQECLLVGEHERIRIGHELHDDVCQVLAGLNCMMRMLAGQLTEKAPELRREINQLNADVVGVMERTRAMAHGLFPARLDYTTLRRALRGYVRQLKTRFGLPVALDLPRRLPHHTPEQVLHVYRIVQEAVGNSIRHGKSTAIAISVSVAGQNVELGLEDNGAGLPANGSHSEGIGLHVMQYRARILGGSLKIGNRRPSGVIVQLKYPVAETSCENKNLHR
jgi:signal transduction histidine kinase